MKMVRSVMWVFLIVMVASSVFFDTTAAMDTRNSMKAVAFLDKLMEEGSKENKLFEGAKTLLSGVRDVDYTTERTIGETFALKGFERYGLPVDNPDLQEYVNLVGTAVARNSLRPTIPYHFVVVDSHVKNAFSCPGGIIFLSNGLLQLLENEGQLANILAHEVAHVQHKHALTSIKRARFLQGVGQISAATMDGEKGQQFESMLGDLQTVLFDKGLDKNMEFEADKSGMEIAYRTGYDPSGMIKVLQSLQHVQSGSTQQGSWFSTHPPLSERIVRCRDTLSQFSDWRELSRLPKRFHKYVH
jgi:predicted Zn-dependent protease